MQKLYIDFDGVILDTIPIIYKRLEKENIDVEIIDELLMKLLQAPIEKERFKKEHCISAR